MSHSAYYPEMNETKPVGDIEAQLCHYGSHRLLWTQLTLSGRGVKFLGVKPMETVVPANHIMNRRAGWNQYQVTAAAFEKICEKHEVVSEILL